MGMKKQAFILSMLILLPGCVSVSEMPVTPPAEKFYPALPQRPRLQFLRSISGEKDLGRKQSAFHEFFFGRNRDQLLGKPYDVAATKGKIYILDRMYKAVVVLDLNDRKISFLNDYSMGMLKEPAGIWVSDDDTKYVADMQRKQVVAFDRHNHFLKSYGNETIFKKPVDVAVFGERVYVIDMDQEQLFILDRDTGRVITAVGGNGEFFNPSHVTAGPSGDVFITDALHFVIKRFSPDSGLLETIGSHGDQIGGFTRPKGAAVDAEGRLYVVDAAFENVQIFDGQGRVLLFFGGPGSGPGDLYLPAGIAIDYENVTYFQEYADPDFRLDHLVYVTSMFGNNMLNVYGYGHWISESGRGE